MRNLFFLLTLALFASAASAQSITFAIERNNLFFEDGSVAGRDDADIDNRSELSVFAGFTAGSSKNAFDTGIATFISDGDISGLNSVLNQISWTSVSEGSGILANARDFNLSGLSGTEDDSALLLVTTASSFNTLTASDQIGLVSSTTLVPDLGTITIGFEQSASWDIAYLGTIGSLNLQSLTVVPEPSTYAALAGLLAFSYVMVRRRAA